MSLFIHFKHEGSYNINHLNLALPFEIGYMWSRMPCQKFNYFFPTSAKREKAENGFGITTSKRRRYEDPGDHWEIVLRRVDLL